MNFFRTYADEGADLQRPAEAAVVITSVLRPTLGRALNSIFAQDFPGRIHILIGVDAMTQEPSFFDKLCERRPSNCSVQFFYPGYSTSRWRGGLHPSRHGGVMRLVLTYLANSPYVAYLDDDNWWAPEHLATLAMAVRQGDWAFSYRWFVHPATSRPICYDEWESVGPGRGAYEERFGGFSDPNTLMINKLSCADAIPQWNWPLVPATGNGSDRNFFEALRRNHRAVCTHRASCFYVIGPEDGMHPTRLVWMGDAYEAAGIPSDASAPPPG